MSSQIFNRITIIGLGLIGSSISRAARKNNLAGAIIGYDSNELSLAFARKEKFIDTADSELTSAVSDSDLVIIAIPPASLSYIAENIAPYLKAGTIVMDVASVKGLLLPLLRLIYPQMLFLYLPTQSLAARKQA